MTRRRGRLFGEGLLVASFACFLMAFALLARPESGGTVGLGRPASDPPQKQTASPPDLGALLVRVAEYCRRLEAAAFDFVCREEINELINIPAATSWGGEVTYLGRTARDVKSSYVYDYQCVRAGGSIREVRTLLKENGKEKKEPNALLKTEVVVFGTTLMGPVGLFGARFQPDYDFAVVGQDKVGKTKVLIVDARPKPDAPETTNLYGKAWVEPATADILRIEWSEGRVGRFDIF
ncbi:MAG TPA: hypothetical protein VEG35_05940, partial [Burkholderiales bacterium]|nr:hypothetical protein [Burkholderiales bacterium]